MRREVGLICLRIAWRGDEDNSGLEKMQCSLGFKTSGSVSFLGRILELDAFNVHASLTDDLSLCP